MRRHHVAIWLIVASELLTAFQMREGVATLIVLALNAIILWLAVSILKKRQVAVWLAVASEIMTATQMSPTKGAIVVLSINAVILTLALVAARIGAACKDEVKAV